jgi:hypothetical protein
MTASDRTSQRPAAPIPLPKSDPPLRAPHGTPRSAAEGALGMQAGPLLTGGRGKEGIYPVFILAGSAS